MVRLLAIDIDGTLLDTRGNIPPANVTAVARAIDAGVEVVLATGRRYEFARTIFSLTETTVDLSVASPHEFPAKVTRPAYSVLENSALKAAGLNAFGTWQDGLREYLRTRVRHDEMSAV